MSDNDKNRIKIKLPAVSYDIVKLAATLTGTSVKSFAAQAVINAALHVTAEIENRSLGSNIEADIHLTEEEAQALLALVESLDTHDGKDEDVEEATAEDFEEEEPAECECDCKAECKCDCDCKCEDDAECNQIVLNVRNYLHYIIHIDGQHNFLPPYSESIFSGYSSRSIATIINGFKENSQTSSQSVILEACFAEVSIWFQILLC